MLKFSANLSTMFKEFEFLKRFDEAKKLNFEYVEIQFPYDYNCKDLAAAKSDLKCTLINSYSAEEFGIAASPGREVQFLSELHNVTPYYNALGAKRIHIMSGVKLKEFTMEEQLDTLKQNLTGALCYLENQNLVGVIEPICPAVKEDYFLSSFDAAVEVIEHVDSDHLKLLLDVYHLHKITGDVEKYLDVYFPYAGHIQISQAPDRREPFYPGGEIDYDFVFNYLLEKKYSEPIGLEYFPSGKTSETLDWMKNFKKEKKEE